MKKVQSLEEELKKQIKESEEKLGEELKRCRKEMEEENKEIRRDVEEQLQLVRLKSSSINNSDTTALERMIAVAIENKVAGSLQNFTNTVTGLRDEIVDLKEGMNERAKAIHEDLHDTKRQMSEVKEGFAEVKETVEKKMDETTRKVKEQTAAIRDEVQDTQKQLTDDMAAKLDELKMDIQQQKESQRTSVAEPQEVNYTAAEVETTPHGQCFISSKDHIIDNDNYLSTNILILGTSANYDIDSVPKQATQGSMLNNNYLKTIIITSSHLDPEELHVV